MQSTLSPPAIRTLGELKASGYHPRSVKDEMRANLVTALRSQKDVFDGILGFEETVIPDIQRAILSRHHILLLGLRGQAKTRIARKLIDLLDEWIPCLKGTELPEDPLDPITFEAISLITQHGDHTPITWMHRSERYVEKLATPDVSIADLIGDVDPIKAASMKLSYADERVIHFGLVPRAHRGIFVINELPDLQPRIQVALFNILQEGDIQIRGFKKRLNLDIAFLFTANPEDYTNRGSIITPLKDRIDAQILTHYPLSTEISQAITHQEARIDPEQALQIRIPAIVHEILDQITFEARESEFVDLKSGVSARLNISAYETLVSAVERRILLNGEGQGIGRINDFWAVTPSITGKVELVYEGEQEGPYAVAMSLLTLAIRTVFLRYFPHPDRNKSKQEKDPYGAILAWFAGGNALALITSDKEESYMKKLGEVAGISKLVASFLAEPSDKGAWMEFVLHGLAAFQQIGKEFIGQELTFRDDLADALGDLDLDEE